MRISVTAVAVIAVATASEPLPAETNPVIEMLPGVVEPADFVTVAAPFDGVLRRIDVSEGQEVDADTTLARMDDRVAAAALRAAKQRADDETTIRLIETELESATRFAERVAVAHRNSAASEVELDNAHYAQLQAERRLAQAQNQLAQARTTLELERARLEQHFIRAPFSGRVLRMQAKQGAALNRSDEILTLVNLDRLTVELQVPLQWFRKLEVGQQCRLAADVPVDGIVTARIVDVEPTVDPATRTFRCRLEIDNQSRKFPAGFTVRLIAPEENNHVAIRQ